VMKIKKLLYVTKFDELDFNALRSVLTLREAALEHVVFMNVIETEKVAMHRGKGYEKDEEIRLRETANIRFIDWAENLFEQGLEVGVYISVGSVVPQVISAAKREEADLIVIGRSTKGVLEQLYSGSDVTELLRRAEVPVLVFKHSPDKTEPLEKPFQKPLLATDWSPASQRAVEYLKGFKNVAREISVVHVASEKELTGDSAMAIQKTRKMKRQKLDEICDSLETEGIPARGHLYIGDTEQEIEKAASESQATMIVMGSSGKSAWLERWLGSTPRTIAEKSVYSTLIVPFQEG
jgi:nucleotide-binding universal stress UspA family protein